MPFLFFFLNKSHLLTMPLLSFVLEKCYLWRIFSPPFFWNKNRHSTTSDFQVEEEPTTPDFQAEEESTLPDFQAEEESTTPDFQVEEEPTPKKVMIIKSMEGKEFVVDVAVAERSQLIKGLIEVCGAEGCVVPADNVTIDILAEVVEYWKHHSRSRRSYNKREEQLKRWDKEFLERNQEWLPDLAMAANYLFDEELIELTCKAMADTVKDMSVEDCQDYFGIENCYTPEEEQKYRERSGWALD